MTPFAETIMANMETFTGEIVLGAKKNESGCLYYAKPVEWEKYEVGGRVFPFLAIDHKNAQRLIDDLWSCGLRPTEGSGSAGALAATQKHLTDMRTIAFNRLRIEEPQ